MKLQQCMPQKVQVSTGDRVDMKQKQMLYCVNGYHSLKSIENEDLLALMQTCADFGAKYGRLDIKDAVVGRKRVSREVTTAANEVRRRSSLIVQLIDAMPQNSQLPGPRFERSGLVQGVFMITCTDQQSLTWLKEAVQRIQPLEGHSFQVMELSQLNKLKSVRVWIPGEKSDPKAILFLSFQCFQLL